MHPQDPAAAIKALEGCEFGYVYLEPTDKLGADVPNPKSHICYGFATHVVILDDDGREVPLGETGEICIRGPQVMAGYWQRPDETALVMTADGYFRSGDIGVMNEQGFVKLVDRKKDMILVSGFNVYPNEVEEAAVAHPKVLEAAAISMPYEHSGEAVKLFIVKKDEGLTVEELQNYLKDHLTGYKRPKAIEFRTELPKSNVGKILRKELKGQ